MKKEDIFKLMKITHNKMYDKLSLCSENHKEDDILNPNVTIMDLNVQDLVNHLKEEYNEFLQAWSYTNFQNAKEECIDIMNMAFLIYHRINAVYQDKEVEK